MTDLARLYRFRFDEKDRARKMAIWKVLCDGFFQKLVGENQVVLDLASGFGEFSNNIRARHKIAVDINPDARQFLPEGVEFHSESATDLGGVGTDTVDVVFTSNFLEHLRTKEELDAVFTEILRVLRPGGRFIVMGPNIRYLAGQYWDFYDHHLPLSHLSLEEGLVQSGFEIDLVKARFLPYTTRSLLPQHAFLVSAYLRLPVFWPLLGKQFLVVGRKPAGLHAPV